MSKEAYILTQDTSGVFDRFDRPIVGNTNLAETVIDPYFMKLIQSLQSVVGETVDVVGYPESRIDKDLSARVGRYLDEDPDSVCICLDRFVLKGLERNLKYPNRFQRFSISRTDDGNKTPRPGDRSFANQLIDLRNKFPDIESKNVIIVDDGIFSGGTIRDFLNICTDAGLDLPVSKVIGFIGNPDVYNSDGLPNAEIAEKYPNLFEWVDIRDFSPFGGKIFQNSKNNRVVSGVPYLFPWSEGEGASLNNSSELFRTSKELIKAFQETVRGYEDATGGEKLTVRDLVKAGFSIPTDRNKSLPISINDRVSDYLERCIARIEWEKGRDVLVFDMDGTLYQLDGTDNGYKGSQLEAAVVNNILNLIQKKESVSRNVACEIKNEAYRDPIGASFFLAKRYGISRSEYFNITWDIDPKGILQNPVDKEVIQRLKSLKPDRKLILLTTAPKVWASRVLEILGVAPLFERIYCGEEYGKKDEIFEMLAGRYDPSKIISVGDQEETDLRPARERGMKTLQVKNPSEINQLLV